MQTQHKSLKIKQIQNPSNNLENTEFQSPQFELLVEEKTNENLDKQIHLDGPKKKQQTIGGQNRDKRFHRSLMVSMIQDEDILEEYFMTAHDQEEKNKQQQNNEINPIHKKSEQSQKSKVKASMTQQQLARTLQRIGNLDKQKPSFPGKQNLSNQPLQKTKQFQTLTVTKVQPDHHTSRLVLEKQKHNLQFDEVYGQIFIYISHSSLIGLQKQEFGYFLLTNYRIIFFKVLQDQTKKRVDLPFGFVKTLQYRPKRLEIVFHLHYEHYWKFSFSQKEHYDKIKIMLDLYAKIVHIKSAFAFSYALRTPQFQKSSFDILKEYVRMRLSDIALVFPNEGFKLAQTYPLYICLPQSESQGSGQIIKSICQNYKGNRLPVLTFKYGSYQWAGLWLCGSFVQDHKLNEKQLKTYYHEIRCKDKLKNIQVYDCGSRSNRLFLQQSLMSKIHNNWLSLQPNDQISSSYDQIVQAYLSSTSEFFSNIVSSKWYTLILKYLHAAFQISEKVMIGQHVVIKEDSANEKSLMISALVQIIIQPFYRTFKGFRSLIMKEFVCFGYRFSSRLGSRLPQDECPTFVLFLDAVSQLIHMNPLYFQFSTKYLAKLSNLMYTNIFGTFLADTPKQFFQSQILQQTVQIWSQLQNELTRNPFYQIKASVLISKSQSINDIRFWSQHFTYLTSQPKDIYKLYPFAQATNDYVPLECSRIKKENSRLRTEVEKQRQEIQQLKRLLEEKKKAQN